MRNAKKSFVAKALKLLSSQSTRRALSGQNHCSRKDLRRALVGSVENLESRQLLAADVLFADSFEAGQWNNNWEEDSQNDWFTSSQRSTDGSFSAEVDGRATDATLQLITPIDLSGYDSATLTFDWLIENGFDSGEYLAADVSSDGGARWTEVASLNGNSDPENQWQSESIDLTSHISSTLLVRFRALVSGSREDANVDNVRIIGENASPTFPPTIDFQNFSNTSGLNLVGDAAVANSQTLRLTPALMSQQGAAWYTEKQFVSTDWESTFTFNLNENFGDVGGSDGFAFVIQNDDPTHLIGGGGALGYQSLRNSVAIEFDTYQNTGFSDPSGSHISVHTNGTNPNGPDESYSIASYVTPGLLDDGASHDVRIRYSDGTLEVFYDDLSSPVISVAIDLSESLNLDAGKAWTGFTAATGGGWQNHDIVNWQFKPLEDVTSTVTVGDVTAIEGQSGSQSFVFTVDRQGDTSLPISVDWTTVDESATGGTDYIADSGQLSFAANETQKTIAVTVLGDTVIESHESFRVLLSNLSEGTLADELGKGEILTDDVTVSVNDGQAIEGDSSLKFVQAFTQSEDTGLIRPWATVFGPDGDLYVSSRDTNEVLRFDGTTGTFLEVFVEAESGPLESPSVMAFGPDGYLYVAGNISDNVVRYDSNGNFDSEYVSTGALGLDAPRGLVFDASGDLYVSSTPAGQGASATEHRVLRFAGPSSVTPGAPLPAPGQSGAIFVPDSSGGLKNPYQLDFGPDGNLYVASASTDSVNRYDATTGEFIDEFLPSDPNGMDQPVYIEFSGGYLYVTSVAQNQVLRFDAIDGSFQDVVDANNEAQLDRPIGFTFDTEGNLYVANQLLGVVSQFDTASTAVIEVSLSSANALPVSVDFNTTDITALAGSDYSQKLGTAVLQPGETSVTLRIETIDDLLGEGDETFAVNLSNATGATIADGQAIGTILDNEVPNQPPVADAGADQTIVDSDSSGSEVVTLNGSGSDSDGTIVAYEWTEGSTVLGNTSSISPDLSVGTHVLTLTVTDDDGATASDDVTIVVQEPSSEVVLFEDSFEIGSNNNDWAGLWTEDSQDDFFRSTQRSTDGNFSAEVDGNADDATLTLSTAIDLTGYSSATLTFDWLIENGFDSGEYLALDIYNGTAWQSDVLRLNGNSDPENQWHSASVDLTPYASSSLQIRFRSQVNRSNEDANIDNVRIVGETSSSMQSAYAGGVDQFFNAWPQDEEEERLYLMQGAS